MKVTTEYCTKSKQLKACIDGQEVPNIHYVEMGRSSADDMDSSDASYTCSMVTREHNKEHKTVHTTRLHASDSSKALAAKASATASKAYEGFVEVATKAVASVQAAVHAFCNMSK